MSQPQSKEATADAQAGTGTGAADPVSHEAATAKRSYLPAERRDMILSLLTRQNVATVPELAKLLNTTEITIRRDLGELADAGLLRRIRGGAMSVGDGTDPAARHGRTTAAAAGNSTSVATVSPAPFQQAPAGTAAPTSTGATSSGDRSAFGHVATGNHAATPPAAVAYGKGQPAIGVMLPEPSFFWPGVIGHMRTIAGELGLRLIVRESSYDEGSPDDEIMAGIATDPDICGLIVAPNSHPQSSERAWQWIEHAQIPTVVIERDQPPLGTCYVDSVRTNHPYGVRKAAVHFLQHGHTRIGAAFSETPTSSMIQKSWRELVAGSEGRIDCPFICDGIQPYDAHGVDEIVDRIIDTGTTAMLVHSDYLAIAIAQVLERRGKRVPDDVSLISIDGFATPSSRPLTVLRSSAQDLAEAAIDTLIARIQHPDAATRHIFVDPTLIDRGSVVDAAR
ncbi:MULTISPECIES: substrate-binding domain-containing protein [Bifidobacterium]|uniref:substrate-binding domain-containing protein n=1 Tax=Bifidobacterium TaxID=1678 RepID=UPI001BDC2DDD|nr:MULTISPECIES: substrate-binding domain-containing protein [Bifidobacterium]MBT1161447.1 DeoR/GlpR family transcriptional regulator [Bifidobacterium sp. SO1]MBW3078986.1 DeoR/GlpR family transcriptional regulator [Bifidobacterium simiiventris]